MSFSPEKPEGSDGAYIYALGFATDLRNGKALLDDGFETLDGDWDKVEVLDKTDDGGTRPNWPELNTGRPVDMTHAPTRLRYRGPAHQVPQDVNAFLRGTLLVSDRCRAIVERFEPGRHQFVPVSVERRNGKRLDDMHILVIGVRLNGHNHDLCRPPLGTKRVYAREKGGGWRVVFHPDRIKGRHLWHEIHRAGTFISAELAQAFDDARLEGYRVSTPLEVIGD